MLFWLDFVGLLGVDGSPLCSFDTLRFYRIPHPSHLSFSHVPTCLGKAFVLLILKPSVRLCDEPHRSLFCPLNPSRTGSGFQALLCHRNVGLHPRQHFKA